jgi:hypothetical protein
VIVTLIERLLYSCLSGQQKRGAFIAFCGFYIFGIPIAALLMFLVRIDIYGFWIGIIAAETVTNSLLFILIGRFNWKHHSDQALKRITMDSTNTLTEKASFLAVDNMSGAVETDVKIKTNDMSWFKLLRVKLIVLFLMILLLSVGITTSITIPLYTE